MITHTIEKLDVLEPEAIVAELSALEKDDPGLVKQITGLMNVRSNAAPFMQTRMPQLEDPDHQSLAPGSRVGVWEIDELIGSGGMGEVFRAHRADGLFEQKVALKLAKATGSALRQRFDAERQRLAQLDHPNIARIVDGGVTDGGAKGDGAPYMTMEFVDGLAIDKYAKANALDRDARLGLIEKLCGAIAHAHGRLVLHRDIKHDNVLINNDGELRLIDFGVASLVDDTSEEGLRGPLTIAYAAPEQLRGEPVSAATDIFAIGMLAHFLETGSLPKRLSEGGVAIDRAAIGDEDLAAILGKATAFAPAERYASADALAQDLHKFVSGFPVAARPVSAATRFKKLVARNTLASAMSGAAVLSLVIGLASTTYLFLEARTQFANAQNASRGTSYTVEHYESTNETFGHFVSSFDANDPDDQVVFERLKQLEKDADDPETDAAEAARIYIFLSEFYEAAGLFEQSGKVAQKLDDERFEPSFARAITLLNAVLYAFSGEDRTAAPARLDTALEFFEREPDVHRYPIAWARCLRARSTRKNEDEALCLETSQTYLASVESLGENEVVSSRTIMTYAAEAAIALGQMDDAKRIVENALEGYAKAPQFDELSTPKAAFVLLRAQLLIEDKRGATAAEELQQAKSAIADKDHLAAWRMVLDLEAARAFHSEQDYTKALAFSDAAFVQAGETIGAESSHAYDALTEKAKALLGLGKKAQAKQLIDQIIAEQSDAGRPETWFDSMEELRRKASV